MGGTNLIIKSRGCRKLSRRGRANAVSALACLLSLLVVAAMVGMGETTDVHIADFYSCDSSGNAQNYFPRKTVAYFNVTVRNLGQQPTNVSLHLAVQDELDVPVGADQRDILVPQNSFAYCIMSVFLPKWAYIGFATAYASVWVEGSVVDGKNIQIYIGPEDLTPPVIHILSPENVTYETEFIPLVFSVSERTTWIRYCLNNQENATADGNASSVKLANGSYKIVAYANDTSGNVASSEEVYFNVSITHDVAVTELGCSSTEAIAGQEVNITATVLNEGTMTETFNVSIYANNSAIGTLTVFNLARASQGNFVFTWNTTSVATGNYTMKAVAGPLTGEIDVADNVYIDGNVKVMNPPVAAFTFSPAVALTNDTVIFNSSPSASERGIIVSFRWDFGDGTLHADGAVATHSFADDGTYTVTLTVTDGDGLTDTDSQNITVLNRPPTASFTEPATTAMTDAVINFDASSSYDPDGSIVDYTWDFGDGANATGLTATHSYAHNGTYNVTLTVKDDDGAMVSASIMETILNRPDVAVSNVGPSKTILGQGYCLKINVTAVNKGDREETFNVTVYANTTSIATQTITLTVGESANLTFTWNCTGFNRGINAIRAYAWPLPDETNTVDNNSTDGMVLVTIAGDVTSVTGLPDGKVDMRDIYAICLKLFTTPSNHNWDPNCDINGDSIVNMKDIAIAIINFNKHE